MRSRITWCCACSSLETAPVGTQRERKETQDKQLHEDNQAHLLEHRPTRLGNRFAPRLE